MNRANVEISAAFRRPIEIYVSFLAPNLAASREILHGRHAARLQANTQTGRTVNILVILRRLNQDATHSKEASEGRGTHFFWLVTR
jgi:hypothetical protein